MSPNAPNIIFHVCDGKSTGLIFIDKELSLQSPNLFHDVEFCSTVLVLAWSKLDYSVEMMRFIETWRYAN